MLAWSELLKCYTFHLFDPKAYLLAEQISPKLIHEKDNRIRITLYIKFPKSMKNVEYDTMIAFTKK